MKTYQGAGDAHEHGDADKDAVDGLATRAVRRLKGEEEDVESDAEHDEVDAWEYGELRSSGRAAGDTSRSPTARRIDEPSSPWRKDEMTIPHMSATSTESAIAVRCVTVNAPAYDLRAVDQADRW